MRLLASFGFVLAGSVASWAEVERPERLPKIEFPTKIIVKASIDKGCSFLGKRQNPNGSWGSARQTKGLNIFAPVPGSHRAFQLAVTSLSTAALIENKGKDPAYAEIIRRGEDHLLAHSRSWISSTHLFHESSCSAHFPILVFQLELFLNVLDYWRHKLVSGYVGVPIR